MLYPQEDKEERRLLYACRNCSYVEVADSPLVSQRELMASAQETAGVVTDIGSDLTLPRSDRECPNCHAHECVFFQSQQRRAETAMTLFYVCVACNKTFR
ncbi:hypothetical protein CANCADRAFT_32112 [Tortispora caseinolytica NRRL Y-17796]|uniref:DNA-directed RNA polymerase II subunit RPB9 n=1 Tax=Tortispora caseinolytica NRRL Y-17796 TaxID=767744 RepID=A0A1E4T9X0_9ASCO|nr:hypothetical protein CANCADRAFT_32112 [Tortispora caseinolytica NRRL Y-17796]